MGVALPDTSGWPKIAEKNRKICIGHKLLDGDGILKNTKL